MRDSLLGVASKDIDIEAFGLPPDELVSALRRVGRVDEVGRTFSVLTVTVMDERIDVALPRRESKTGPGHRDFEIVPDPHIDTLTASVRRDFTMNALAYDPTTGEIVDHHGGQADLEARVLRHVGPAFAEDPLRVLRGMGFAARFEAAFAPETLDLARRLAPEHSHLSTERLWGEWAGMAAVADHPGAGLRVLAQTGWEVHYPELSALHAVEQSPHWHPEGNVHIHTELAADRAAMLARELDLSPQERRTVVLATILHDVGKATHTQVDEHGNITHHGHDDAGVEPARTFLTRIGAPGETRRQIERLVAEHMSSTGARGTPSLPAVRRLARRLSPATMEQWAIVNDADKDSRPGREIARTGERWLSVASRLGTQQAPARGVLGGAHLIAAGLTPGPAFKEILAASVAAQDDGEFDDEAGAIAWLEARLGRI